MSTNVPSTVSARDHCHIGDDVPPSRSVRVAVSSSSTSGVPVIVTVPSSLTFLTLTVSVSVSSIIVSSAPEASSLSLT